MDTRKSLANMTKTQHVLIGHYDLLGLMDVSAPLSRRSVEIHFPRYHLEQPEDLKEFKKLMRTFQRHLPLLKEPDLQSHFAYFYERSLGCIGMLKTMLNKALGTALEQGEQTLTAKHWERHAEPPSKLKAMLHEILAGEQRLKERGEDKHLQDLRAMLYTEEATPKPSDPADCPVATPLPPMAVPKRKQTQRVWQRNATTDTVGQGREDVP